MTLSRCHWTTRSGWNPASFVMKVPPAIFSFCPAELPVRYGSERLSTVIYISKPTP